LNLNELLSKLQIYLIIIIKLKGWITDRTQLQKIFLALESFVVVIFIFFAHLYIYKHFDQAWSKTLFSFFLFFIPSHHALAQSFGLNYIYNSLADKKTMLQLEKYERWLSVCFMVLILSYLTIIVFPNEVISFFGSKTALLLRKFTLRGTFLATLLFVVLFLKYPKEIRLKKIIFSSRYLVWFCALFSHSAAIGTRCIHGIEYACVTHKVMSRSKGRFRWLWLITLSALVAYICYFREVMMMSLRSAEGVSGIVASVASLSIAISYLHYFLDRRLFRMRHTLNRKTMGALLID
jgi:hypothetical protein